MKKYFCLLAACFCIMFDSICMAQSPKDYSSFNSYITSTQDINAKIYIDSNSIFISDNQILTHFNGELMTISFIAVDDQGIYTYIAGYQPWHDDDWRCSRGHWNPMYENRCVVCRLPKTPQSPRWGDQL